MKSREEARRCLKSQNCVLGHPRSILTFRSSVFGSKNSSFGYLIGKVKNLVSYLPCGSLGFFVEPPVFLLAFLTVLSNELATDNKLFALKLSILIKTYRTKTDGLSNNNFPML